MAGCPSVVTFGLEEREVKFSHFLFKGEGVVDIDKFIKILYLFLGSQNEQLISIEILSLSVIVNTLAIFISILYLIGFYLLCIFILLFFNLFLRMLCILTIYQLFI